MTDESSAENLATRIRALEGELSEYHATVSRLQQEIAWRRRLVDESRDGIVVLDEGCKVREANRRFAEMLGYTMDEVRQLHVWDWDSQIPKDRILELARSIDEAGHHFETRHRRKDGSDICVELSNSATFHEGKKLIFCICRDITERLRAEQEREELVQKLRHAAAEIRTLRGILPLCSFCHRIRDDEGQWERVDVYIARHSQADVSHGICPSCMKAHYPEVD